MEDLDDDRHLVIKESQLQNLKDRLGKVRRPGEHVDMNVANTPLQDLDEKLMQPEESESE